MSTLIRNFNTAVVTKQVLNRVSSLLHTSSYQRSSLPSNVEEIAAKEKVAFSSNRHRDLSQGVVQSQTASVFGMSAMNNQMSQLEGFGEVQEKVSGINQQQSGDCSHLDNYDSHGAINLNAAMRVNIPQPFAPVIDKALTPNLSMPAGPNGQQNKYVANDMQETLHSGFHGSQGNQNPKAD